MGIPKPPPARVASERGSGPCCRLFSTAILKKDISVRPPGLAWSTPDARPSEIETDARTRSRLTDLVRCSPCRTLPGPARRLRSRSRSSDRPSTRADLDPELTLAPPPSSRLDLAAKWSVLTLSDEDRKLGAGCLESAASSSSARPEPRRLAGLPGASAEQTRPQSLAHVSGTGVVMPI
jgi:hypothetical protein